MSEGQTLITTLNRKWTIKMSVFLLALIILGVWGTVDAVWLYPRRGEHHTQFMLKDYLQKLSDEGALMRDASVPDPAATFAELSKTEVDPTSAAGMRKQWLESLSRIARLLTIAKENQSAQPAPPDAAMMRVTTFADPRGTLDALIKELGNRNVPKPLSAYDIPLQWLFAAIGFGGTLYMIVFLLRCRATKFRYNPDEKRLTLPSGKSFVPADIREVDKREWHKFFLHMKIDGFEGEQKFDLLRYAPLEDWLEEMRKLRPGYDPAEDAKPDEEPPLTADEKSDQADAQQRASSN